MPQTVEKIGVPVLFLALSAAAACDRSPSVGAAPTALAVQPASSVVLTADPALLRMETIPDTSCVAGVGKGTRLVLVISGDAGTSVLGLRFRFVNAGTSIFPEIIPIPGPQPLSVPVNAIPPQAPLPTPGVAPLPTMPPIQLPQPQRLPLLATLGCGPLLDGVLVVTADVANRAGLAGTSQLQVPVSR
jgi:hypothetical protein